MARKLTIATVFALSLLGASAFAERNAESETARPNILLLTTDQQWIGMAGCYGNDRVKTPAVDALGARGIRFTRSYTANPICSPARAAWETGRPAHQNGVWGNNLPIRNDLPTLGSLFAEAGYEVLWTGKRHLPVYYPRKADFGFQILPWWQQPSYPADPRVKWGDLNVPPTVLGTFVDEPVADTAVEFLRGRSVDGESKQPFLLSVQLLNPHDCCMEWHHRKLPFPVPEDAVLPPLPDNFEISTDDEASPILRKIRDTAIWADPCKNWDRDTWRRYLYRYERFVEAVDEQVGRVLQALDETGEAGHTVVLFTSDHGDGLGAHRWANKNSLYREAVEVPFLLAWPGHIRSGQVDHETLISGFDVFPTLLDCAGLPVDDNLPGRSLWAVLSDDAATPRPYVVTEVTGAEIQGGGDPSVQGRKVHTHRHVYMAYADTETGAVSEHLFDMQTDRGETTNLLDRPEYRDILQRHRAYLAQWCEEVNDPFPQPVDQSQK